MATRKGPTRSQASRQVRPSEKATWHQITGAGKSHVKREFFGLSESDVDALMPEIEARFDRNLATEG